MAPPFWKAPSEVVHTSDFDASWVLPFRDFPGTPKWEETPGMPNWVKTPG